MRRRQGGAPFRRDDLDVTREGWTSSWTPTEAEFQDLFVTIAKRLGWAFLAHVADSRRMDLRSTGGLPDWFAVNPQLRRQIWVELKGWGGKATDEQRAFVQAINDAGGEAYIVTTSGDYGRDLAAISDLLSMAPADVARSSRRGADCAR